MTQEPITRYQPISLSNFERHPRIQALSPEVRKDIRVVGTILPFKTNNYVMERLIDWDAAPDGPIFRLNFPHRDMIPPKHYSEIERLLDRKAPAQEIKAAADLIRMELNPHPAGQLEHNVPTHHGKRLEGMQHKYRETVLFFPSQGQTCHAYCTFCFRWPQFVGLKGYKLASQEGGLLAEYMREHPHATDVLFTGGDPMVMKTRILAGYIEPLLKIDSVRTIRIGTKALAYWPQRFLSDPDSEELLDLFRRVGEAGKNLAVMAHFNHWQELTTPEVPRAVHLVRVTGAQIRTQSPLLRHINDSAEVWSRMWQTQVEMGMIPYYMFIARDTGAKRYFEMPLADVQVIYREAIKQVSGLARTVRGPSMSATPGKVRVMGVAEFQGEKVFVLNFLQGRKPEWVGRPFLAKFDPKATWLDQLKPAFGKSEFFYEAELREMFKEDAGWPPEPVPARG